VIQENTGHATGLRAGARPLAPKVLPGLKLRLNLGTAISRSLLCVGVCFVPLLATGVAHAADSSSVGCPVAAPPLSLPEPGKDSTLIADQATVADQIATATGNVHLERNGQTMEAPYVRYNRDTTEVEARNGVKYLRPGLYLTADNAHVNTGDGSGQFNTTEYSVIDSGARGKAATIASPGDNRYQLTDADYSTCPGPTKAWLLSARRIDLDRNSGRGVAHDATMRIYGVPVLYTPYINFPIDNQRHTGFLAPTIGASSNSGFQLAAPYYINIAPNYDATIVPRVLADRGFQLGAKGRYLFEHNRGQINGEYLPSDQKYGADRGLVNYEHIGELSPYVGIQAQYNYVTDDDYFHDLSNNLSNTSTNNLERSFQLTAVQPDAGVRLTLLAQDFQTLDNDFNGIGGLYDNEPYRRLPQARLEWLTPSAPFQAGVDAEYTAFDRNDSVTGTRADVRPRLVWGTDHGGWFANSEAAYRVTRYQLDNLDQVQPDDFVQPNSSAINRDIPSFQTGAGLRFSKAFENGWIQTFEPQAQYLLVGYEDQSDIPVFDSGIPDLHYDRLFSNNRYTGIDRIGDANQLTIGVTSRVISPDSGREVAKLDLGRVTGFRDLRVRVPNSGTTGYGVKGSDYVAGVTLSPTRNLRTQTTVQYDPDDSQINRAIATATIGSRTGYQLDLGYRFYRDYRPARNLFDIDNNGNDNRNDTQTNLIPGQFESLSQTVLGVRAPINDRFEFIGRWNYSLEESQNVESLAGIEYSPSCCYSARVALRRYVADNDGSQDNAILFQFVFRGLGQFGDTVQSFVDRDVFSNNTTGRSTDTFDTIRSP